MWIKFDSYEIVNQDGIDICDLNFDELILFHDTKWCINSNWILNLIVFLKGQKFTPNQRLFEKMKFDKKISLFLINLIESL